MCDATTQTCPQKCSSCHVAECIFFPPQLVKKKNVKVIIFFLLTNVELVFATKIIYKHLRLTCSGTETLESALSPPCPWHSETHCVPRDILCLSGCSLGHRCGERKSQCVADVRGRSWREKNISFPEKVGKIQRPTSTPSQSLRQRTGVQSTACFYH